MTAPVAIEFRGREANGLRGDLHDGGGAPVLLLHGAGQTRHAWATTARRLAGEGLRAITLDLRGHGDSQWLASARYSIMDYADDVADVGRDVAARFGQAPVAVGASLGGLAALGAELWHGPLFSALVLVDITPRLDRGGVARVQAFMMDHMGEGFASLEEAADAIARYMPERRRRASLEGLRKNLRLSPDGRYRWHWDPAFFHPERGVTHRAMEFSRGVLEALPRLPCALLLVRAELSDVVDDGVAREVLARAPRAQSVCIAGASHMIVGDHNDEFTAHVLDFLRQVEALPAA